MGTGWSMNRLAPMVGVSVSLGNRMIREGLVTPDVRQVGPGRTGNRVGMLGLLELITASQLLNYGFSLGEVRKSTDWLRERLGEQRPLTKLCLVATGHGKQRDLEWHEGELRLSVLRYPGQAILCIPTMDLYDDLLRRLVEEEKQAQSVRECHVSVPG